MATRLVARAALVLSGVALPLVALEVVLRVVGSVVPGNYSARSCLATMRRPSGLRGPDIPKPTECTATRV
jgi:hypothetical protein